MNTLYNPPDVDVCNEEWGANCGPCCLAAILKQSVSDVKPFLFQFGQRQYMTPTTMSLSLESAGLVLGQDFKRTEVIHSNTPFSYNNRSEERGLSERALPTYGLAFLQMWSDWLYSKPVKVQYHFTHWVGIASFGNNSLARHVYDVNAGQ